jgi:hypothetical protein
MKRIFIFEDGTKAVCSNCTIQTDSPAEKVIVIDDLPEEEYKKVFASPNQFDVTIDEKGKLKLSKKEEKENPVTEQESQKIKDKNI